MTPDEKAELKAEIQKDFQEFLQGLKPEKTPFQILADAAYRLFWNWSFVIGLTIGLIICPFVNREPNLSLRLPSPIKLIWSNPSPSPNPSPIPDPATLKSLMPVRQTDAVKTLISRLESAYRQNTTESYATPQAFRAAITEASAPMVGVPEWVPFLTAFDARFSAYSDSDTIAAELQKIIEEIKQ